MVSMVWRPYSIENWLNDVEELLEDTGCIASQKVPYTAYKLSGEARRWWQAKKMMFILELVQNKPSHGKCLRMSSISISFP
ncbi:hypothetical protein SLA2020_441580 [Shorea laevis]